VRKELTFGDGISAKDLKKGDVISGIFLGLREVKIAGRDEPGIIIQLQSKDGPVDLWAPTSLQSIASQLATGTPYEFEYQGKTRNPKSGRDFHAFKVFEDDGVTA
jgi:hypothetical protein